MARYQRAFTWDRDENIGEYGWIPEWLTGVESPYAMIGDGTAHDTLEHEAHESDGNLENETRALGAVYFVRGESGWFGRDGRGSPDPEVNLASDFIELYLALQNGDSMGDAREAIADPHGMAPTFAHIVRRGIRLAISEYRREDEDRPGLAEFARGRRWLLRMMVEGYNAAHARFDGHSFKARELFERIARAATDAARECEDTESGRLIIDVDTIAGKFHAVCELYENPTFGDGPLGGLVR